MLLRTLTPIVALCCLALWVIVAAASALTFPDDDLAAFLAPPPDCAAPCFMGVQPDITPMEQAAVTLENHAWVRRVSLSSDLVMRGEGSARWSWTGEQPDYLLGHRSGRFWIQGRQVSFMTVDTTIRLGDVWALYGQPAWMTHNAGEYGRLNYALGYPEEGVEVFVTVGRCGASVSDHLHARVTLVFDNDPPPFIHDETPTVGEVVNVCR